MAITNIEIKASCTTPEAVIAQLKTLGARFVGIDHQIDTYFNVPNGRLKLREGNIENALIFYKRANDLAPKRSDVILFKTNAESALKFILLQSLGTLAVVDKQRHIFFIENVKFHVDTVANLGSFVEIEAIDTNGTIGEEKLNDQCNAYMKTLNIKPEDLISESYSDLMMKRNATD